MLTIEEFEEKTNNLNGPGWLSISVDETDDKQFYITGYAGMGETMSRPIALFGDEIEHYVREKLKQGLLVKDENKRYLLQDQDVLVCAIVTPENLSLPEKYQPQEPVTLYRAFLIWQKQKQQSDTEAMKKLGMSAQEFMQFKENKFEVDEALLDKLVEVTKVPLRLWKDITEYSG